MRFQAADVNNQIRVGKRCDDMKGIFGIFRHIDALIRDVSVEHRTAFISGFAHTGGIINAVERRNGIYAAGTVGNRDRRTAFMKIDGARTINADAS